MAVAVRGVEERLLPALKEQAEALVVAPGDQPGAQVGPLIRDDHRRRVVGHIEKGLADGARLLADGRPQMQRAGWFLGPTILEGVTDEMAAGREEIFGPVLSVSHQADLDTAIGQANRMALGNMAVIFTSSGRAARRFREEVQAGMVGVNVPVAQPFAFFPFSGWKGSFYGDLHVHGSDGVDFYTRKKVVVTRW